ncbi:MAG: TIGR03086 family metal-binding protein [Acidimicrobiales bacterium]
MTEQAMTTEPTDQLRMALEATEHVIAGVGNDQWTMATPCSAWNVGEVVSHLVSGNDMFVQIVQGSPLSGPDASAGRPGDLLSAYRESAEALVRAFCQPDVLSREFTLPMGRVPGIAALHLRITEVLVHGWDLARGTGQVVEFPEALAEAELRFSATKLGDVPPEHSPFAPPQQVAEDASAMDRLAALLGRTVS